MGLFRKEALESFSSSSRINKGIRAVFINPLVFTVLLTVCAAVFAVWLVFGTIYETVSVSGVIWPSDNSGTVYTESAGTVSKTTVSVGSRVNAGDILAVIPHDDILGEIAEAKAAGASEEQLEKLRTKYDRLSVIRSNLSGIVTQIADENSYIPDGGKIAQIVPYDESGNNKTLTAFIPSDKGSLINLGMEAQVMPDFAPREEYGYIKAYVSAVASYSVTGQSIKESNSTLFLSSLDERESYLQIQLTLLTDASAQSRLKWSNPKSGGINVAMGTICDADIIIEKCRPYRWLF